MTTRFISDLRAAFYGGNLTDGEFAFLQAAYDAGVDASDLIALVGAGGGLTPIADQTLLANTSGGAAVPVATSVATVKTMLAYTATDVGLGNVTNTSDANKPVSTAQQAALNLKADVTALTAANVGLGNVTNTSDANKPVSTAQQAALDLKANLNAPTFSGVVTGTGNFVTTGGKIGYNTGAGGTVTQITSRTTGVTLDKSCGTITLFTATLAADTDVTFVLTNSFMALNDAIIFNVVGGAAVKGGYRIDGIPAAGSCTITVHNITPTITASEAPQIRFAIIRGVAT